MNMYLNIIFFTLYMECRPSLCFSHWILLEDPSEVVPTHVPKPFLANVNSHEMDG